MGRPPRRQAAGEVVHVTSRGVRRGVVFIDDHDYRLYLALLGRTAPRASWIVLGYCLMPNHVHLLVRLQEPTLAAGMHRLHGTYARRFNERHGYSGHVFEARYRSVVAENEAHQLEVFRYLALNPVRAGLCADAADWRWSSHRAIAGLSTTWSPVAVTRVRTLFGSGAAGVRRYWAFVAAG